ncbi:hypothetical protein ACFL0D_01035 [Thermoproteota archaeon]
MSILSVMDPIYSPVPVYPLVEVVSFDSKPIHSMDAVFFYSWHSYFAFASSRLLTNIKEYSEEPLILGSHR